ncbi:MAG: hypothetical protein PHE89_05425 [Alphaproteobacteria bacterium]|nr:hypothetical protein [Alphaproteobacteria bacterium]
MKKRRNYLTILSVVGLIFLCGIVFNVRGIRDFYVAMFAHMSNIWVLAPAALVAFIFIDNKNYWMIVLGLAVVDSLAVQIYVGNGFPIMLLISRVCAFVGIVFLMNMTKVFMSK